jgi:hypothetical protein
VNPQYQTIWEKAKPYLQTRSNDTHTRYCYYFAEQLCEAHPEADPDIVLPAIILHDIGWSTVPEEKQLQSFGPHMIYPDLRRQHEIQGAKIATDILISLSYSADVISNIASIIDGHDTRTESLSIEDSLVRDADKLWRYTPFGLKTIGQWFQYTQAQQMNLLHNWIGTRFYSNTGRNMARGLYGHLSITTNKKK